MHRVIQIFWILWVAVAFAPDLIPVFAQTTNDPFSSPITAEEGVIKVDFVEFASIPDLDGEAARVMMLIDEPGTRRMFVNDMRGPVYSVSYDGQSVSQYIDVNADKWGVSIQSSGRERGMQSFALPSTVRSGRDTGVWQVLHLDRHQQHGSEARLCPGRRGQYARYCPVGIYRPDSRRRNL